MKQSQGEYEIVVSGLIDDGIYVQNIVARTVYGSRELAIKEAKVFKDEYGWEIVVIRTPYETIENWED